MCLHVNHIIIQLAKEPCYLYTIAVHAMVQCIIYLLCNGATVKLYMYIANSIPVVQWCNSETTCMYTATNSI